MKTKQKFSQILIATIAILLVSCNGGATGGGSGVSAIALSNAKVGVNSCLTGNVSFSGTVWYVSGSVNITNNCSSQQSLLGQNISFTSQDLATPANLIAIGTLNNWWVNNAAYTLTFTSRNGNTEIGVFAASSGTPVINPGQKLSFTGGMNLPGKALYDNVTAGKTFVINGVPVQPTPSPTPSPIPTASPIPSPMPSLTPLPTMAPSLTVGTINFHFYYGTNPTTPQDSLTLTGDNYTDLIMSNYIAGVMYGHLIAKATPGMQFNKDYLYGSIFAQLLQENQSTELYNKSTNYIAPLSLVGSNQTLGVMGVGQGGPYQINNYAVDMVNGTYAPAGFSMINYVAIQKNIGYTMATASTQHTNTTPISFNNKYYGPILTAYFHFNDYRALQYVGGSSLTQAWSPSLYSWIPQWQPYFYNGQAIFKNLPNNFLDILLNVAYNQGFYGTLFLSYSKLSAIATKATIDSVNSYSMAWGGDTYQQYPYQVHNYLDQLYNNPTPSTTDLNVMVTYNNHIAFSMPVLAAVFSNVFQTLAYINSSGNYIYIPASEANKAFSTALTKVGVATNATLDLGNKADRGQIFSILENAISILEANLGTNFSATTQVQL